MKIIKQYTTSQFCVFGDVHGQAQQLEKLLKEVRNKYPYIDIFSTGDLIDRGPQSKEVIDLCINYCVTPVTGNHEAMLIEYLKGETGAYDMHINPGMGGAATVRSYLKLSEKDWALHAYKKTYREKIPKLHRDFYLKLAQGIVVHTPNQSYLITHAGLNYVDHKIEFMCKDEKFRDRILSNKIDRISSFIKFYDDNHIWEFKKSNQIPLVEEMIQITGHLPYSEPQLTDTSYQIDTGCGKNGKLTGIILPEKTIVQS